ncbi:glycosyl hydrolase family 18 protein [Chitinibacter sp. SCUT-21]|uniref:glycoside hydrolase family 18 protein n=1 Tax=Chitinibacter sp. SCUT-21 TaxID=2970891 RepID=UPI0035A65287
MKPIRLGLCTLMLSLQVAANDKLITYLPTWKDASLVNPAGAQLGKVDYAILSFIEVTPSGEAVLSKSTQNGAALWKPHLANARKANPQFNCMWAIGGWSLSANIAKTAQTDAGRSKLAKSALNIMRDSGCIGLDLDWEHPVTGGDFAADASAADFQNWVSLLREMRKTLDEAGKADNKKYLLTAAIPANNGGWVMQGYNLKGALPLLDWVNLMAYDRSGGWSKTATLQASLHSVPNDPDGNVLSSSKAVEYLIAQGAKPAQLVLGVPFYVRGLGNVAAGPNGDGLVQSMNGPGLKDEAEAGVASWADFQRKYAKADVWKAYRNAESGQSPYLYHAAKKELITFDDPISLAEKVKFVKTKKLGGVMIWEITQDDAQFTLLNSLKKTLNAK